MDEFELTVQPDLEPLPDGLYHVRCIDVNKVDGQWGAQARFTLEVAEEGPYHHRTLYDYAKIPEEFRPRTKLFQRVSVWLGGELPEGARFKASDVVDRHAAALVEVAEGKEGVPYNKVLKLTAWDGSDDGKSAAVADALVEG
jgi:hypothetical protein